MYRSLDLMDDFSQGGKAKSEWRISSMMNMTGRWDKACTHAAEVIKLPNALGQKPSSCLEEADFDVLLDRMVCWHRA